MSETPDGKLLPDPPSFSEEEMKRCSETGDYTPALFEWYKFVASLAFVVTHILRTSPAYRTIPDRHYHVAAGLMNRCARLMLSNVALSHEGKFGETTSIVDRCIFESAIKIAWLCENPSDDSFVRYLADGLKTELEFRAEIKANIAGRGTTALPIETRMLRSIANHIAASGLSDAEITSTKKLPDLASQMAAVGQTRLHYVIAQRIGSHHVHGTWPSLLFHYLEEQSGDPITFVPRGHDCKTHINQYMYISIVVLRALRAYVNYALHVGEADALVGLFASTEDELMRVYTEAVGGDLSN
jgi:hypothetical protein